jgi:Tfp pilus assembly protein PilF
MSSQRRRTKTPARVQVFFFEKKPKAAVTAVIDERVAEPCDTMTSPAIEIPQDAAVEVPARRPKARGDASSHITEKMRIPEIEQQLALQAKPLERRNTVPTPVAAGGAREALEYHRQKLEQFAARGEGQSHLADLALFGHTLYARGRLREAQVVFESIVAKEPEEAYAYTMLGAIFLAQNDDARALALFDAALGMDPQDLAARVGRGEIRLRRGQPDSALVDLERAIAADPSGRDPFGERARALSVLARTLCRALR